MTLEKAVALAAFRRLLDGATLPADLVAEAIAADLMAARRDLADFLECLVSGQGWSRHTEWDRGELLQKWKVATPEQRSSEWGAPKLRTAILARTRAAAAAAREERLSRGIDLDVVLSAETIEKLVKKGFVSAAADRDPVTLSAAVFRILEARFERSNHAE
jgi:hypothetical protein